MTSTRQLLVFWLKTSRPGAHLMGEVMDLEPDELGGRRTTARVLGRRHTKALIIALVAIECLLLLFVFGDPVLAAILGVGLQAPHRRTSQSSSGRGPTMSPRNSILSFMQPKRLSLACSGGGGGMILAMGLPRLVTSRGCPVWWTRSRTARQVALNWEIAMLSSRGSAC